jgi:hypothetical protein
MFWGNRIAFIQKQTVETGMKAVKQRIDTDCTIRPKALRLCFEGYRQAYCA